mmetsp:Transcript_135485/g.234430  ORF Transcript_135485/g.234430 Transcript_135485/m.234430 type:complete len:151 (-) Transcript_135485:412-864(-)
MTSFQSFKIQPSIASCPPETSSQFVATLCRILFVPTSGGPCIGFSHPHFRQKFSSCPSRFGQLPHFIFLSLERLRRPVPDSVLDSTGKGVAGITRGAILSTDSVTYRASTLLAGLRTRVIDVGSGVAGMIAVGTLAGTFTEKEGTSCLIN